jgi:hypothetical protein
VARHFDDDEDEERSVALNVRNEMTNTALQEFGLEQACLEQLLDNGIYSKTLG